VQFSRHRREFRLRQDGSLEPAVNDLPFEFPACPFLPRRPEVMLALSSEKPVEGKNERSIMGDRGNGIPPPLTRRPGEYAARSVGDTLVSGPLLAAAAQGPQ
jgi:hypothetical protein